MSSSATIRRRIEEIGIVPSIRSGGRPSAADEVRFAIEALHSGGLSIAEVSTTSSVAIDVISQVARNFPDMIIGADLLDLETARRCLDAGAKFFTTPGLVMDVVEFAVAR